MIDSSSVRRALSQVRDELSPTRDDKARLRTRILVQATQLGAESGGPDGAAPGATVAPGAQAAARAASLGPWATLQAAGWVGAATALTLLGVGGGAGFWLGHSVASSRMQSSAAFEMPAPVAEAPQPAPDRSASAAPARPTPPALSEAADVAAAPPAVGETRREPHPADVPPRAHAAERRARPNPLDADLALLRRVERALRNDEPALARALLGELDERFPDSRLGEERSAARRIADCRSGEPGASESARAFLREHAASVYRKRIVLACALEGEKGSATPTLTNPESADTHDR